MASTIIKQAITPKTRNRIGNKTALKKLIWRNLRLASMLTLEEETPVDDALRMKALSILPQLAGTYLRILESEAGVSEGRVIIVKTNLDEQLEKLNEQNNIETPF